MSFLVREVAHCDICGHEWITSKIPSHCAKCKSRKWNQGQGVPFEQARRLEANYAPIGKESMTEILRDMRKYVSTAKHLPTCKCLMCKPPKP